MSRTKKYLPSYCYSSDKMKSVDGIVVHYFSGKYQFPETPLDIDMCYNLFKDLNRPASERDHYIMNDVPGRMYSSAHFLIGRKGEILDLVPVPNKAWHAGTSEWDGKKDCNTWMIGIEMVATAESGYTDEQYDALIGLTKELIDEHGISWDNITGHENIAPGRKKDPGSLFDWPRYRAMKQKEVLTTVSDIIDGIANDWFGSD